MLESSAIIASPSTEPEKSENPASLSDGVDAETIRVFINVGTKVYSINGTDTFVLRHKLSAKIVPDFCVTIDGCKWFSDYKVSSSEDMGVHNCGLKITLPIGTRLKQVKDGSVIHDKKYTISDPSTVLVTSVGIPDVMRLSRNGIHILTKFGEGYDISFRKDQRIAEGIIM